jgi:hypothetical protein
LEHRDLYLLLCIAGDPPPAAKAAGSVEECCEWFSKGWAKPEARARDATQRPFNETKGFFRPKTGPFAPMLR